MKHFSLLFFVAVLAVGCTMEPAPVKDTRADDEAAIRQLLADTDASFAAKDMDKAMMFYADDAALFLPGSPILQGKDAMRPALTAAFADTSTSVVVTPIKITVAKSGELAYGYGTGVSTMTDPETGKKMRQESKWVTVFEKQPDGSWHAVADIFNPNEPPAPVE